MGRQNGADRRMKRAARKDKKARREESERRKAENSRKKEKAKEQEKSVEEILAEIEREAKSGAASAAVARADIICNSAPSRRTSASLVAHPTSDTLLLFGGELFDGKRSRVYGDLFSYHIKRGEWRRLQRPNAPTPRCAHQAVCVPRQGGQMWVFGGEFTNPTGSQFHHFGDLWCYHLREGTWEKIEAIAPPASDSSASSSSSSSSSSKKNKKNAGAPSPRSGHRMVAFRNRALVVFGGFHDNNRSAPKYYKDVHIFDLESYSWHTLQWPAIVQTPEARSACQLVASNDAITLVGGYAGQRVKGEVYKGVTFADVWRLTARELGEAETGAGGVLGSSSSSSSNNNNKSNRAIGYEWTWTKVKPGGDGPDARCGAAATLRPPNTLLSFGGVCDRETEDSLQGDFHDTLYALDLGSLQWRQLRLRRAPLPKKTTASGRGGGTKKDGDSGDKIGAVDGSGDFCDGEEGGDRDGASASKPRRRRRRRKKEKNINAVTATANNKESNHSHAGGSGGGGDGENASSICSVTTKAKMAAVADTDVVVAAAIAALTESSSLSSSETEEEEEEEECIDGEEKEKKSSPSANEQVVSSASSSASALVSAASAAASSVAAPKFWPRARMNTLLCVKGRQLFLFGGAYEVGDRQLTLNDMYSIDLSTMTEWDTIVPLDATARTWLGEDTSSSSSSSGSEGED
eukprot:UC1_evm3s1728